MNEPIRHSYSSSNVVESGDWPFEMPAVHNAGNLVLQIYGNSMLGNYDDEAVSGYWPKNNGQGHLSLGGFWAGGMAEGEKRVMNLDWDELDWNRTAGSPFSLGPGVSDQDGDVTYDDRYTRTDPLGVEIHQQSYQWSDSTRDDFILFRYTVQNMGINGTLNDLYTAVWLDPDGSWEQYSYDQAGYDSGRTLLYVFNEYDDAAAYTGIKLLGRETQSHSVHAFSNYSSYYYYDYYDYYYDYYSQDPENDEERLDCMSGGIHVPEDTADYHVLLTAPPRSLNAGETFTVAFGLVMGNGLEELQAHADTMESVYERLFVTGVENCNGNQMPGVCSLEPNYPNPFNPATTIGYYLASDQNVTLQIFNTLGEEVETLTHQTMQAGMHQIVWNASGHESGIYFCRIQAGDFTAIRKMIMLK